MNLWLWFAGLLLPALIPCGIVLLRGQILERFVALQMAQIVTVLAMLLLAEGYHRDIYFDMALVLAVLAFPAGLVFVRFLERWL